MTKNVGCFDRTIRIAAGLVIIGWGASAQNWLGAIGIIPLVTGIIQWCPAYCPFGISTKGNSCSNDGCSK
jgi:hypothetical protein